MYQTFTPKVATRPGASAPWARLQESESAGGRVAGLLVRSRLAPHRLGHRWLASASSESPTKVVYLVRPGAGVAREQARERLLIAAAGTTPHALKIEAVEPAAAGGGFWIVCPYTGSADGLLTLGRLLADKHEGRMDLDEARRATGQILQALDTSHMRRMPHGAVVLDDVLVDRRGGVLVELLGVGAALGGLQTLDVKGEVRSVVRCAFELITGVQATGPSSAYRAPGLSRVWRNWLAKGLRSEGGFNSAAQALASLPSAWR